MGPGRSHERFAAGFVAFFVFILVVAALSSCQPQGHTGDNNPVPPPGAVNATMK